MPNTHLSGCRAQRSSSSIAERAPHDGLHPRCSLELLGEAQGPSTRELFALGERGAARMGESRTEITQLMLAELGERDVQARAHGGGTLRSHGERLLESVTRSHEVPSPPAIGSDELERLDRDAVTLSPRGR